MAFQMAIWRVLARYARFDGRTGRSDYGWWVLFVLLGSALSGILDRALFGHAMGLSGGLAGGLSGGMAGGMGRLGANGPLQSLFLLAIALPWLAVSVRRLQDTNRSGWWMLLALVPLVGTIPVIWWLTDRGTAGKNRFGPAPAETPSRA